MVPIGSFAGNGHPPWAVEERMAADPGPAAGSVADWLDARVPAADRRVAAEWFRQNWAADPADLAAAGVAAARRGDLTGSGEFAVPGGFSALPRRLAAGLEIRLGHAVRRIRWQPGRAELSVSVPDGPDRVQAARAVVVTTPPPVVAAGRLVIDDLPAVKMAAAHALALGDGCCLLATLDRVAPQTSVVFDADGHGGFIRSYEGRPEVLIVAKAGAAATVRAAITAGGLPGLLAGALPWAAGARITGTEVADWGADPWITGALTFPRVGAGWAPGSWARPVAGTLFFAGEATWARGAPRVHSAMFSGERAAREILSSRHATESSPAEALR
jgi:monoamine oxidase